ncbi:hypothetical protein DL546_004415 [Coniochaeta pulveracea]|uniref:Topoisomerase I damage affected protein 2 n=1 Tax=Coniochaeta pulveracea TaxID=177199 RepID=A0A420YNK9_9PEZI|nr:hypothetical protein DL546_004415 [Coniochaeta pulveracea]
MSSQAPSPLPVKRLEQITADVCESVLGSAEGYDHTKTAGWNQAIIDKILKAVTSELEGEQRYKFAINSTIVQHSVPTAAPTYASTGTSTTDNSTAVSNTEKKKAATGRRGMHSATGGYWNQATDGMWSYKYEGGDDKGFDVVIMLIWIGF